MRTRRTLVLAMEQVLELDWFPKRQRYLDDVSKLSCDVLATHMRCTAFSREILADIECNE